MTVISILKLFFLILLFAYVQTSSLLQRVHFSPKSFFSESGQLSWPCLRPSRRLLYANGKWGQNRWSQSFLLVNTIFLQCNCFWTRCTCTKYNSSQKLVKAKKAQVSMYWIGAKHLVHHKYLATLPQPPPLNGEIFLICFRWE